MKKQFADATKVIRHPLATEKTIRLMEAENKIMFVVDRNATKQQVKKAVEELFRAKVEDVNTFVNVKGEKRAYVKFGKETRAIDVATSLGLM